MNFAKRIKQLREDRKPKLYQKELAEAIGVSRQAITMWETNQRIPDSEKLQEIANYFNCSVDFLLGKSNIRHVQMKYEMPKEVENVIRESNIMFDGAPLDDEDKEDVIEVIKTALKIKKRKS